MSRKDCQCWCLAAGCLSGRLRLLLGRLAVMVHYRIIDIHFTGVAPMPSAC